jgi:hypothetical protein
MLKKAIVAVEESFNIQDLDINPYTLDPFN